MNFSGLKSALGRAYETAASTASAAAKDISTQVAGARCLRDYTVQGQVATGGLHGVWKIYAARSRKEGSTARVVSVWILEKRPPASFGPHGRWEQVVELCRKDAAALTRLKHPAVVKILEPMEETRTQLVMVTEAIFASALDLLTRFEGVPSQRSPPRLSELDVKAGLLQVADGLQFLHHEGSLVHRGLSPGAIMVTGAGAWKLAGLALAVRAQFGGGGDASVKPFDFTDAMPPRWRELTQPPLAYTAPELTGYSAAAPGAAAVTPAADIFSLGAVVYELVSGKQLFPKGASLGEYQARLAALATLDFAGCPPQLLGTLRAMLAAQPAARPNANAFAGAPYFQEDTVVRALRFLEGFLQRDALQKAAFLKDLEGLWPRCDARVLRCRVLPPLLAEARGEALQPVVLPLVMRIVQHQEPQDFEDSTLPALAPLCATATGAGLFQLTRFGGVLFKVMQPAAVTEVLIPMLARAADLGDTRTQEEALRRTAALAGEADYQALKAQLLPRASRLCLATTSAAVRHAALGALTALAPRFDKETAGQLVHTLQQVLRVDRSSGTVAGALALGRALVEAWGPVFGAEAVLPVLAPCLAAPNLSRDQFREVYKAIESVLHSIASSRASSLEEETPAVELTASGEARIVGAEALPAWHSPPPPPQQAQLQQQQPPQQAQAAKQPQSVHVPVPSRAGRGEAGQRPMAAMRPAATAAPAARDPFAASESPRVGPTAAATAAADPFAMSGPALAAAPQQTQPSLDSDWLSGPSLAAAPQASASALGSSAGRPLRAAAAEPDPFADWPPAQPKAAAAAPAAAQGGASWQPSFAGAPAAGPHSGSSSSFADLLGSPAPRQQPMAPPKLAPPPAKTVRPQPAAAPAATDSLI